jgi:hypothetical protein
MVSLFVFLCACKGGINNPEPLPATPLFVAAAADTAVIERGIDAIPEENAILVEWHDHEEHEIYYLYRRKEGAAAFALLATSSDTSYLDRVDVGTRYYYCLQAENDAGRKSAPSDTIHYMLLPKANNLRISTEDSLQFHWQLQGMRPVHFILRLFDESRNELVWLSVIPPRYQGVNEQITFNRDRSARYDPLTAGTRYRWRIDCVGAASWSGSESGWHRFTML